MNHRPRFWLETVFAIAAGVMAVVTLINAEWIEEVFHVDPDGGNGAAEIAIVIVLALLSVAAGRLARNEHRAAALDSE